MIPFISRVFGQRAEINPSDAANVWWRLGSITSKMDNLLAEKKAISEQLAKQFRSSRSLTPGELVKRNELINKSNKTITLPDLMAPEEFPALFAAYPKLRHMAVDIKTGRQGQIAGEYVPIDDPGTIKISLPDEMAAATPSADIAETLLHEIQHFIQKTESGLSGKRFVTNYGRQAGDIADNVKNSLTQRKLDIRYGKGNVYTAMDKATAFRPAGKGLEWRADSVQLDDIKLREWMDSLGWREKSRVQAEFAGGFWPPSAFNYADFKRRNPDLNPPDVSVYNPHVKEFYSYKMNPYEREAFEASRRDIDPQYRASFARKLEEYIKKK